MKLQKNLLILGAATLLLFSGCAKEKLVLKTYKAPAKQAQVKKMIANSESTSGFINIEIVEDTNYISEIVGANNMSSIVANGLVSNTKKFINQTNFISLNMTENEAAVALLMQIKTLTYSETSNKIDAFVEVNFIVQDMDKGELYSESYSTTKNFYSRLGRQGMKSKEEILSSMAEYLAKKFIKDISPMKTMKIVYLKDMPKLLNFTATYAKAKNFAGAVKGMENYKGERTYEFYFNLAVYYEGLASQKDDMSIFSKASENYEKAMAMCEGSDEVVVSGKQKFDNFYDIIKSVKKQNKINNKRGEDSQNLIL